MDEAVEWLRALLANGPVETNQIRSDAKQAGIAWRTVERAKGILGVKSRKRDFAKGWWWSLPEHGGQQPQNVGGLRESDPLEPSCGAGSTEGRHASNGDTPSTPLKPSCGAGSSEGRHASQENISDEHLRSNLDVARVVGVSGHHDAEGDGGLRSNLAVVRVVGDRNSEDRQDREVVGKNGGDHPSPEGDSGAPDAPDSDCEVF